MKNLITILTVLTITFTSAFATKTPEVLISSAEVEVFTIETLDFITNASFDADSDNLVFDTSTEMSIVQIFNATGEMEFQLPVMSNNVQINRNFFDKGNYKLGFILEGQTQVHFTSVTIK